MRVSRRMLLNGLYLFSAFAIIYLYKWSAQSSKYKLPASTKLGWRDQQNSDSQIFQAFQDCFRPKLEPIKDNLHTARMLF